MNLAQVQRLVRSKTFYACLGVLGTAISGYAQGQLNGHAALLVGFGGLAGIFLRIAIHDLEAQMPEAAPVLEKVDVEALSGKFAAQAAVAIESHTGIAPPIPLQADLQTIAKTILAPPAPASSSPTAASPGNSPDGGKP